MARPASASRDVAAVTSPVEDTSTPRWSMRVASPGSPSSSTSFSGGSAIAKLAYPGRRLAGGTPKRAGDGGNAEEAGGEGDSGVEVGHAESKLHTGHGIHLSLGTSTGVDVSRAW